jgi:dihydroxyacid dehydratase/phosphogluconate dehydratase
MESDAPDLDEGPQISALSSVQMNLRWSLLKQHVSQRSVSELMQKASCGFCGGMFTSRHMQMRYRLLCLLFQMRFIVDIVKSTTT